MVLKGVVGTWCGIKMDDLFVCLFFSLEDRIVELGDYLSSSLSFVDSSGSICSY